MAVAYTPGLRVTAEAAIRRVCGDCRSRGRSGGGGETVAADGVIARAEMPGNLHTGAGGAIAAQSNRNELTAALLKPTGRAGAGGRG